MSILSVPVLEEAETQVQSDNVTPDVAILTFEDVVTINESGIDAATSSATKTKTNTFNILDLIRRDPPYRLQKNHLIGNIIGELTKGRKTRDRLRFNYQDMVRYV